MAAASLPRERRKWAIIIGGSAAIILRIVLTGAVSLLMLIPLLSAIGGIILFWVVYKLLGLDVGESEEENKVKAAGNSRQAILIIVAADITMSLDNVIAVAGTAHGNFTLLIAGLLLSMPLLMTTGGFISYLIDRFKWLVFAGAFAIAFTGSRMILEDRFIEARFSQPTNLVLLVSLFVGILVPASFVWFKQKMRVPAPATITPAENEYPENED